MKNLREYFVLRTKTCPLSNFVTLIYVEDMVEYIKIVRDHDWIGHWLRFCSTQNLKSEFRLIFIFSPSQIIFLPNRDSSNQGLSHIFVSLGFASFVICDSFFLNCLLIVLSLFASLSSLISRSLSTIVNYILQII